MRTTSNSSSLNKTLLAVLAASALALPATMVLAQPAPMPATAASGPSVARADSSMIVDIAQANMAEVASGKLALEKSQSAEVKKFAQQMIDDHSAALQEVQALATSKNVKLPDGPDLKHKTMATAMKALSGNTFDNQYAKRAGVADHEATMALLQKTQRNAKDADLKALATKMLPTVQHHLTMAQELVGTTAAKK